MRLLDSKLRRGICMAVTRLPESPDYMARREELRQAELELMRQREHVAALRRDLPTGLALEDYVFEEGPPLLAAGDTPVTKVRLSELFTSPDRPLIIYHLMYGKQQTSPCPMCTCWVDGFNGVARHLAENVDFAVVAAADPGTLRAHAARPGMGQAATPQLRRQHVPVRLGGRGCSRGPRLHCLGLHAGPRRDRPSLLLGPSEDG